MMLPLCKIVAVLLCLPCLPAVDFAAPNDIANGSVSGVSSMDAGDINGDGRGDVIVIEGGKHAGGRLTFAWFAAPANAQGPWTRHNFGNTSPLRSFLGAAKLADMDNDGDLDVIVSSDNHSGGSKQGDVLIYVNPGPAAVNGTWSYHKANTSTLPVHHMNDMEIADLDGDGKNDIIVRALEPNQIHIFFQDSISSYQHKTIDSGIERSEGLSVGQLDSDGLPDITFTGHWLKSPSNPRTQHYTKLNIDSNYKNANQNTKEAIGDIDGDGLNDVIISPAEAYRNGGNASLAWYKNPGTTASANWQKHTLVSSTNNTHTVKLGDMDNDGDLDVVTGTPWSNNASSISVRVYYNNGVGNFGAAQVVTSGKGLYSGVVHDIDDDGDLDIIGQNKYAGSSKPYVYENLLETTGPSNQPPRAHISASTTSGVMPLAIAFTGNASTDADGTIVDYAWDFGDGSSGTGLAPSHTYTSAGTFTATLTVTDDDGLSAIDTVNINISATSAARDAYAKIEAESFDSKSGIGIYNGGTGKKIGSIENGTYAVYRQLAFDTGATGFTASVASNTSGGSIELRIGSATGTLLGSCAVPGTGGWNKFIDVSCSLVGHSGTHDLYMVFSGGSGSLLDVDYFQFNQGGEPENVKPVARAEASTQSGVAPLEINFHADASSDADGSIVSYSWDFADGTSATGAQVSHTFNQAGTYVVTVVVTDDAGATDQDTLLINLTEAGAARDAYARIEAESYDSMSGIGIYPGGSGEKIGSIENGTYAIYEAVDFGTAASGLRATVSSKSKGGTVTVHLGSNTGTTIGSFDVPKTGNWNNFVDVECAISGASGIHDLHFVFSGGSGALFDIDYFQFEQGGNQVPQAIAAASTLSGPAPLAISFDASASQDSDGSIVSYAWDFGDAGTASGATASYTYTDAGTYELELTVTDNQGATAVDTLSITVTDESVTGVNAFARIEAEDFDSKSGIGIYPGGTGRKIGSIENGTYAVYENINFASGAVQFEASTANKHAADARIELRLGSTTGNLIGSCNIPVTGNWNAFVDVSCPVSGASGVHDLYFVFVGGTGSLLDVDYFQFVQSVPALIAAPMAVAINFQPASAATVDGYLIDSGAVFANRQNGFSYGWSATNDAARDRNHMQAENQLEDTLNHFSKNGDKTWSIALPNGSYDVYIRCGDPTATDQVNTLYIADYLFTDADGADNYDSIDVRVVVSDGQLTIAPAPGAQNAKICYIEIMAVMAGNG